MSVFDVFKDSFRENLAKKKRGGAGNGEFNSNSRRVSVDEAALRAHVSGHLQTLMNTIRLDAVMELEDAPHVAASVLNYGFQDLSNLTRNELSSSNIKDSFKQSLRDHEPRLVSDSVNVEINSLEGDVAQRITLKVAAELIADPADIPVDYTAELDSGAGKVILDVQS